MSIEYLVGRKVDAISVPLKDRDWYWALLIEGGVRIQCIVPHVPKPEPENVFVNSVIGAVDALETDTIHFYKSSNPGDPNAPAEEVARLMMLREEYEIIWPKGQKPPHVERDLEADLPADPSPDRVAEGPVNVG